MQPDQSYLSPNGRYRLDIFSHEVRISHWIDCPSLFDCTVEKYIFSTGQHWDASNVKWSDDGNVLKLDLRHYGQDYSLITATLELDKNMVFLYTSGNGTFSRGSLSSMGAELSNTTEFRTLFY